MFQRCKCFHTLFFDPTNDNILQSPFSKFYVPHFLLDSSYDDRQVRDINKQICCAYILHSIHIQTHYAHLFLLQCFLQLNLTQTHLFPNKLGYILQPWFRVCNKILKTYCLISFLMSSLVSSHTCLVFLVNKTN